MHRPLSRLAPWLAVLSLATLAACDYAPDWFGAPEDPPLPGERISVLQLEQDIEPDPAIADLDVKLPAPWPNQAWPQADGYANHAMHHLALGEALATVWRRNVGAGSSSNTRLLSRPVIGDGRILVLDAESHVGAFEAASGKPIWRVDLTPEEEDSGALGGGLALAGGVVFATTGYGEVFALEAASGATIWKRQIGAPFRVAPAVAEGRVFAISYDNRMTALAADDGRELWSHDGIAEDAGLVGGATPAVDGGIVVAPYSSGQLFGLRVENGRVVWQDQLVRLARFTPLATLSEIRGSPVIDRGLVYAISHSGRMVAIDLRSGDRIWERDIEGVETPWVAGDFIFLVTTQAEVICLSRRGGRIRWVTQLQRFEDEEDHTDPVRWAGPVLGGDRLILLSSHGRAVAVSPYTGQLLGEIELAEAAVLGPVVAEGTLFILTDDAELIALR